jgi:hypothetical protein
MHPVMAGDGAMCGFGFDRLAVGGHQDGGHETKGAKTLCDHVRLDVAVIILAGPDELARPFQGAGNQIVDQAMFVNDAGLAVLRLEFLIIDFLEQIFEAAVISLEDGVLGRQIDWLFAVQAIVQAGAGEIAD